MRKVCKVTLNKDAFLANCGELLLDSALMNGVDLPHDCRSGVCGACRVRLAEGKVFGGTEEGSDMIYACQARIVSDLKPVTEAVPEMVSLQGRVVRFDPLPSDVVGVSLDTVQQIESFLITRNYEGFTGPKGPRIRGRASAARSR